MINIAEILKDCPEGTKLYSPICGDCTFEKIHLNISIVVCTQDYRTITFNVYGQYFRDFDNAECLLFPSKENRDWNTFIKVEIPFEPKIGDVVVDRCDNVFIYQGKYSEYSDNANFVVFTTFHNNFFVTEGNDSFQISKAVRYATANEEQLLFDIMNKNGYVYNELKNCISKKEETKRKFKDGDIISNDVYIAIFHKFDQPKGCEYNKVVYYHCWCDQNGKGFKFEKDYGIGRDTEYRFATDGEKQKLFDVIKANGYKWNPETKTLE